METIGTVLSIVIFGFIGVTAVAVAVIRCYFLFQYEEYRDHMIGDSRPYSWLRFYMTLSWGASRRTSVGKRHSQTTSKLTCWRSSLVFYT